MDNRQALKRLFEHTGNDTDSLLFLKNFQSISPERFGIIFANMDIVSEYTEPIFYDLKLLYNLGLYPILVIQEESLHYIRIFYKTIYESVLSQREIQINLISYSNENSFHKIVQSIQDSKIPIIVFSQIESIYTLLKKLSNTLKSNKIILLSKRGGLLTNIQQIISIINLRSDFENIVKNHLLDKLDFELFQQIKYILDNSQETYLSIVVTSPLTLIQELFTIKGQGTYIKKGSEICTITDSNQIDLERLKKLLENAFKKHIKESFFCANFDSILLENNYRGAAILKKLSFGTLLSKFAVDEIARGEGIGRDIWEKMRQNYDTIFWRAKPNNNINQWYMKECTGMHKFNDWYIYWINLAPSKIDDVCKYLRNLLEDFEEIK